MGQKYMNLEHQRELSIASSGVREIQPGTFILGLDHFGSLYPCVFRLTSLSRF